MIAAQLRLQRALGYDVEQMSQEARIHYIHEQVTNVVAEAMEALQEVDWKSWTNGTEIREETCFGELRDAWQCLTNAMWLVTRGDPEAIADYLEVKLYEKHATNYKRLYEGYDGHSNKCPGCRRAYDDEGVNCHPGGLDRDTQSQVPAWCNVLMAPAGPTS